MNIQVNLIKFALLILLTALAAGLEAQDGGRPRAVASPTPTPSVSPTPNPTATPTPFPVVKQTLTELQAKIRLRLVRPDLRRAHIGVKIVSLNSGKVIFEENAEKYFMPASNMKNFTVATAIEKLTPDFRFVTSVYAPSLPDSSGTIKGDLRIVGRGDVSISSRFNGGDIFKGLDALVEKILLAGVKRIEGDLIGDESYFAGFPIPLGWEWDDLQWSYGAEVSALPINDNMIDISVRPGPVGYACSVRMTPYNPVMRIMNQCTTTGAGTLRTLVVHKRLDQNIIEISGTLPSGSDGFSGPISISHPAELFAALLKQRLQEKGVTITGNFRAVRRPNDVNSTTATNSIEIAKLESPPLSLIASFTMKPSQNMYTETLLWTLGENARNADILVRSSKDSSELGIEAVKKFLIEIGVAQDAIIQHDGSGLSRHNLITPNAVVQLYTYMAKQSRHAAVWRNSLTIGGVDGTLTNRFKGTAAAGNIRGKTGTIDQVSALSGYITTAGGEQLVLSIIVNGLPAPRDRISLIDEIVLNLANFSGRVD